MGTTHLNRSSLIVFAIHMLISPIVGKNRHLCLHITNSD
jgi:hypothetical protein